MVNFPLHGLYTILTFPLQTDNVGYGAERRKALNAKVLDGTSSFRDAFYDMLHSVKLPFNDCISLLTQNIKLDPGFTNFYNYCTENNIPVIILSGGMEPIIRALLKELMGDAAKGIEIISNQADVKEDGSWEITYRDER